MADPVTREVEVKDVEEQEKENQEMEKVSEDISSDDFLEGGKFISLKVGEEATVKIAKLRKVTGADPRYNLSAVDYKYEIDTEDDKVLTLNSWAAVKGLRQIIKDVKDGKVEGHTVKFAHKGHGSYEVSLVK